MALVLEHKDRRRATELEDLTFEQICPMWARVIKYREKKSKILNMDDFTCCLVGESHGFNIDYQSFNSGYRCEECVRYAMGFPLADFMRANLAGFIKHYNEKHKEEWYQRQTQSHPLPSIV